VLLEAEKGPRPEPIRQAIEEGWVAVQPLYADSVEYGIFLELRAKGFGLGEASSIAACSTSRTWVFVSDDLDARREASHRGVGWSAPMGYWLAGWPRTGWTSKKAMRCSGG